MMHRRTFLAGIAALVTVAPSPMGAASLWTQEAPTVVYVVRHAERAEDGTNDPPISEAGWERARLLASMLADAGVTTIHSTDYRRTRSTAEPLAKVGALATRSYDPDDLEGFAEELRRSSGRHLVVGHSNTTRPLVEALGGDPSEPIEEMEYDRLYVLTLTERGTSTVLIRFGAPFEG